MPKTSTQPRKPFSQPKEARVGRGRPRKDLKPAVFKLRPDQHEALTDTAIRARLARKPNASEGASLIVRHLVQDWIDEGKKWPDEDR